MKKVKVKVKLKMFRRALENTLTHLLSRPLSFLKLASGASRRRSRKLQTASQGGKPTVKLGSSSLPGQQSSIFTLQIFGGIIYGI